MGRLNGQQVEMAMPRVVFATPTLDHRVSIEHRNSLLQASRLLSERNIGHDYIAIGGDCYLAKVRNKLVTMFLRDFPDSTDLFFLDEDVGFPPEKVVEFLLRPEPVVAGVYPKKSDNLDFPVQMLAENGALIEEGGFCMVGNVGAGFLRIKRKVLEVLAEHAEKFREYPDGEEYHNIFSMGMGTDHLWWGEDYVFVQKVVSLGGEVWVDPDIAFTHRGMKAWSARLSDHLSVFRDKASQKEAAT